MFVFCWVLLFFFIVFLNSFLNEKLTHSKEKYISNVIINEDALKDSVGHYNRHKYKTRFTLDYSQMYMSFDSYYGTTGMGIFLFSDILGDHRIGLATELQIDFEESDYFFSSQFYFLPNTFYTYSNIWLNQLSALWYLRIENDFIKPTY